MVNRIEPFAHVYALSELDLNFLLTKRLEEHEANHTVEGGRIHPAWKKSSAHEWCKVALLDVEHVCHREHRAEAPSCLTDALCVVESVDNCFVDLPVIVIHPF